MTAKQVDAGTESFSKIIDGNCYYVDKTRFLRPVFATTGSVRLFTRPMWKQSKGQAFFD